MSKMQSDNFKYDIPDNSKFNNQEEYEEEMHLVHEDDDEDFWNQRSDESNEGEGTSDKEKGDNQNPRKKRSLKKQTYRGDRKK